MATLVCFHAHPGDEVTSSGGTIARAAAGNVVPCVLELGGKSAASVHDDADLDAFENDIRWGIFFKLLTFAYLIVLLVLLNQPGQENAFALMEELVYNGEPVYLH